MAFRSAQVSVTTTRALVYTGDSDQSSVSFYVEGADIYLGDSTVTTSTGAKVPAGTSLEMEFFGSETVYAVTAAGTATVHVAEQGVS